jgi:phenylalanine ammonia-lyase
LYESVLDAVGKKTSDKKPFIFNDDEQQLDEYIDLIAGELSFDGKIVESLYETVEAVRAL